MLQLAQAFAGQATMKTSTYNWETGSPEVTESALSTDGNTISIDTSLASRAPVIIEIPLSQTIDPASESEVQWNQYYADVILHDVTPENPAETTISLPDFDQLVASQRLEKAELRLVLERLAAEEGVLVLNGERIAIPAAETPENTPALLTIPISPNLLQQENNLRFEVTQASRAGYLLGMASIDLTTIVK